MRVLSQRGLTTAVGLNPNAGYRIPHLMRSRAIKPHVDKLLMPAIEKPIPFKNPTGGGTVYGYPATLLVDICQAVLAARDAGRLTGRQLDVAARCDILIRSLAKVGIIALVDEATGYQRIREERALAAILEEFLDKELQPWTRTFPFTFYEQIFRLKGWGNAAEVKRPSVIGHYTNDFVYDRIAPGVLDELRRRNPVLPQGWRKNRHHQWFTPEFGTPRLKMHLEAVTALMRAARTGTPSSAVLIALTQRRAPQSRWNWTASRYQDSEQLGIVGVKCIVPFAKRTLSLQLTMFERGVRRCLDESCLKTLRAHPHLSGHKIRIVRQRPVRRDDGGFCQISGHAGLGSPHPRNGAGTLMACPDCASTATTRRKGRTALGSRRFRCQACPLVEAAPASAAGERAGSTRGAPATPPGLIRVTARTNHHRSSPASPMSATLA